MFPALNQSHSSPDPGCLVHLRNITGGLALPFSHSRLKWGALSQLGWGLPGVHTAQTKRLVIDGRRLRAVFAFLATIVWVVVSGGPVLQKQAWIYSGDKTCVLHSKAPVPGTWASGTVKRGPVPTINQERRLQGLLGDMLSQRWLETLSQWTDLISQGINLDLVTLAWEISRILL